MLMGVLEKCILGALGFRIFRMLNLQNPTLRQERS
jgi:hypothetical protein